MTPSHRNRARGASSAEQAPRLFSPLRIRGTELANRLIVAPMCQYSSHDGMANDWHMTHLGARASGGAGLVITEATAVHPLGRISPSDLGIWADSHVPGLSRLTDHIRNLGSLPGIQLGHAGRKASAKLPWEEGHRSLPAGLGGWMPVAPSPVPFGEGFPTPHALTIGEIADVVEMWAQAARRAAEAGFEVIEIHAAHGYLIHEFLSPVSNTREDMYGGIPENRRRFALEVIDAIRSEWPSQQPLFMRISATDWIDDLPSWRLEDSIELARIVKDRGVDLIDCSSGSMLRRAAPPETPGFQVPFADAIRRESRIMTAAVGMITSPHQAERILIDERADLIAVGRAFLADPHWGLRAAAALGADIRWPNQYLRARGSLEAGHD